MLSYDPVFLICSRYVYLLFTSCLITDFPEYTSRRVHVAEWIDGEKLSSSKADDVGALVNLGVITYLTQLLDAGFFHAE